MKRFIIAVALVLAPVVATAQTATQGITTKVKVKSAVSFTLGSNLDFGAAIPGATASIDEFGVSTTGGSLGAVSLAANQAVTVTASYSGLTGTGAPITSASVTPACSYNATAATASAATSFDCTTGFVTPATGTGAAYYFFLGGAVSIPAGQQAGVYNGTATVTGSYTNY